jgi:peptidoglycan hydrolase-like protein with peptidoglycan-binding domain
LIQFMGRRKSAPFSMSKLVHGVFLGGVCAAVLIAAPQTTTKKSTVAKKPAAKPAKGKSKAVAQGPARQAQPSSDRYREIQTALAQKGYFKGEPTGVWDQGSIDAMRQFQEDQKLEPTGKLTSRSLISLGLGPNNNVSSTAVPQPPK